SSGHRRHVRCRGGQQVAPIGITVDNIAAAVSTAHHRGGDVVFPYNGFNRSLANNRDMLTTSGPKSGPRTAGGGNRARLALMVGALGVVFGDIGTSPIYTIQTVFNPSDPHPVPISEHSIYGIVSLVFWSVMIIVTYTYVTLVMRADNHGEGGIMALITLVLKFGRPQLPGPGRTVLFLASLGIFGAALFFGDSMITPAISVLSAVEGLKVVEPRFAEWIVPITAVIIVALV